jgi:hypothetical protein
MNIKFVSNYAGPLGCFAPGTERDHDEAEAKALIAGGYALDQNPAPSPVVEHADAPSPVVERAVVPRSRRR